MEDVFRRDRLLRDLQRLDDFDPSTLAGLDEDELQDVYDDTIESLMSEALTPV